MGGTPMDEKRADEYLKAIGPLVNAGKLQVMNLHSYHDSRPKKPALFQHRQQQRMGALA